MIEPIKIQGIVLPGENNFPVKQNPGSLARVYVTCFLALVVSVSAKADFLKSLFSHEVDVITVTDVSKAGEAYPAATLDRPVYYMIVNLGLQPLGTSFDASRSWAGEKIPKSEAALKWLMAGLAEQGYRLANETHPPTQLLVYGWGMVAGTDTFDEIQGNPKRPALKFLGGDKVDLMWEQEWHGGFVDYRVLMRGLKRMGVAGKVWDFSGSDLFIGRVRSYTMESFKPSNPTTLLWETRFACPATGLALADSLPLMIKAAAPNFGRETTKPVNVNATRTFSGRVDLGELEILGEEPDHPPAERESKPDTKAPESR